MSLKKASVSDKVLQAMVAAGSPATGTLAGAVAPGAPATAPAKTRDVVYNVVDGKFIELEPSVAELETNFQFFSSKGEIVLPSKKAKYRRARHAH